MFSLALSARDNGSECTGTSDDDDNDDDDDDDDDAETGERLARSLSFLTATPLPLLRALVSISAAVARSYRFSSTHASNRSARAVHSRFGNGGAHCVERASTMGANAVDDDAAAEAAAARRLACRAENEVEDDDEEDCEYIDPFQSNSAASIDTAAEAAAVVTASAAYARGLQESESHSAAHDDASSTRNSERHARNSRSRAARAADCRERPRNSALTRICRLLTAKKQD
jgi:hypothetical protein